MMAHTNQTSLNIAMRTYNNFITISHVSSTNNC